MDYIRGAVGHICAIWRHICSGAYASNVKCTYILVFLITLLIAVSSYEVYIMT